MRRGVARREKRHRKSHGDTQQGAQGGDVERIPHGLPQAVSIVPLWRQHATDQVAALPAGVLDKYPHGVVGNNFPAQQKQRDRKSTRLNSSHVAISYAVFCLKKKKKSYSDTYI